VEYYLAVCYIYVFCASGLKQSSLLECIVLVAHNLLKLPDHSELVMTSRFIQHNKETYLASPEGDNLSIEVKMNTGNNLPTEQTSYSLGNLVVGVHNCTTFSENSELVVPLITLHCGEHKGTTLQLYI